MESTQILEAKTEETGAKIFETFMADFSIILIVGVEGAGLVLYAMIMWILTCARTSSLRTQFYTQSWILGECDRVKIFLNLHLRLNHSSISFLIYKFYRLFWHWLLFWKCSLASVTRQQGWHQHCLLCDDLHKNGHQWSSGSWWKRKY